MADTALPAKPAKTKRAIRNMFTTQAFTLMAGILIMALTLELNNWVIKAQTVLASLDRVNSAFDSFDQFDLVQTYDLCDSNAQDMKFSDIARIIKIGKSIQTQDTLLAEAQDTALLLNNRLEWSGFWNRSAKVQSEQAREFEAKGQLGEWAGAKTSELGVTETDPPAPVLVDNKIDPADSKIDPAGSKVAQKPETDPVPLPAPVLSRLSERETICAFFREDPNDLVVNYHVWRASLKEFSNELEISRTQQMFTGRGPALNLVLEHRLRAKMDIITQWWLPVLNGALGAIVFCLTRILRQRETAPKFGEIVLRMVFGGFAGLVVSTLLLPSGLAFGPYAGTAPGVSLLAFIFGFSLDSFIQLLERLNQLIMEATRPKKSGDG